MIQKVHLCIEANGGHFEHIYDFLIKWHLLLSLLCLTFMSFNTSETKDLQTCVYIGFISLVLESGVFPKFVKYFETSYTWAKVLKSTNIYQSVVEYHYVSCHLVLHIVNIIIQYFHCYDSFPFLRIHSLYYLHRLLSTLIYRTHGLCTIKSCRT